MSLLEEVNLSNDYMFVRVMDDEQVCRAVLEVILGMPIEKVIFMQEQKIIDLLLESKAIRLDVYVKDEKHTIYNVEMQRVNKKDMPKRSRYYQGMIDLDVIDKGEEYTELKMSYVIFLCTFDPFGKGRHIYTYENCCLEDSSLKLEDGTTKLFLNTRGSLDDVGSELMEFFRYLENSTEEQAAKTESPLIRMLHERVIRVRSSKEMEVEYMTLLMRDREKYQEGIEQGIQQGIEKGTERVNILIQKLIEANRIGDLIQSTKDKDFQKELFQEFGLK